MRLSKVLVITGLLAILMSSGLAFGAPRVLVVGESTNTHHVEFLEALRDGLRGGAADVAFTDYDLPLSDRGGDYLITIGSAAANRVMQSGNQVPRIHTLIPVAAFELLYPDGPTSNVSALFIDQPITRQLRLVRLALPHVDTIASLLGPDSRGLLPDLSHAADRSGLVLRTEVLDETTALDSALERLLGDRTILLALPDPVVVNSKTARDLILGAYLRHTPIVGYSKAFVKAGALMGVHSSPTDLGRQTAEMILAARDMGHLPEPAYPAYFQISVNFQVARTLGLNLPPEAELTRRLRQESAHDFGN